MTFDFSDSAFEAFFSDRVSISGTRPNGATVRGTFAACAFPTERADPFAGSDTQSNVYRRTVLIRKVGEDAWNLASPPQIGDTVSLDGEDWKVASVNVHLSDRYELEVRSC